MILVGEEGTKRTDFTRSAAFAAGVEISLVPWSCLLSLPDSDMNFPWDSKRVVKLDPPSYSDSVLEQGAGEIAKYLRCLDHMEGSGPVFWNEPSALRATLDKRMTKQILQENGIPATKMFAKYFSDSSELIRWMESEHIPAVFVKPRFFSGAAGVMALRIKRPGRGMAAYTSCRIENGQLVNTKHLFCLRREEEILLVLDRILSLGAVVEQWHSKETVMTEAGRQCYDLRVVWQLGRVVHMVARGSGGPITNLHLNNGALPMEQLGLSDRELAGIESLCGDAMKCFPGLRTAGIDVMLERGSRRPLIIEINGQGDLIYQDIYGENQIYREQMEWVRQWETKSTYGMPG